jgi:hypothetical protein
MAQIKESAKYIIFLILLMTLPTSAKAQQISLNINNIPQETAVWCWAAVAQQIILAKNGPANTPPQCAMVALAYGASPQVCCNAYGKFNGNQACLKTGSFQQIQGLIAQFGGSFSTLAPPAHPQVLYQTLQQGRPVILALQSTPFSGHVVVLRGMHVVGNTPVLHINDPMAHFTQPVPFQNLMGFWNAAIVVN